MYRLVFYKMDHINIMNPFERDISFSISIETAEQYGGLGSILDAAKDIAIDIMRPPMLVGADPSLPYIEAETLEEAHYLCMMFGYTITGQGERMRNSTSAEYMGLHECGTLEEAYEKELNIKRKGSKSA